MINRKYENRNEVPNDKIELVSLEDILDNLNNIYEKSECLDDFLENYEILISDLRNEEYS